MQINLLLFGRHAFRKSLSTNDPEHYRSVINIAFFDVCSVFFARILPNLTQLQTHKIRESVIVLLQNPVAPASSTALEGVVMKATLLGVAALLCVGTFITLVTGAEASTTFINFDVAQANYTPPPPPNPPTMPYQWEVVDNQFAPLGIIFRDGNFPNLGGVVSDHTGCTGNNICSLPWLLYGNSGNTTGDPTDATANLNIFFVDPNNLSNPATTTFFSVRVSDSTDTTVTAFDLSGAILASMTTTVWNETVAFSNVGQIARINLTTLTDATGFDDINFETVAPVTTPLPAALPLFASGLGALGLLGWRRKRKNA